MEVTERNYSKKLIFSRRTFRSSSSRTINSASAIVSSTPSKPTEIHVFHGDTIFPQSSSSSQAGKMESASRQGMITSELLATTKATHMTSVELENNELPNMKGFWIDASRVSKNPSAPVYSHKHIHRPQYKASHSHLSFRSRTSTLKDNSQSSTFRNLECTYISDIIPTSSSSIDHNNHSTASLGARFHAGGSSRHRGIDVREFSARGYSISSRNWNAHGQYVADQLPAQENTRRVRNHPVKCDGNAVSVRTRRASSRESRVRSELKDESPHSITEPVLDSHILMTPFSFGDSVNPVSVVASLEEPTPQRSTTDDGTSRHVCNGGVTRSTYSHDSMHDGHGYQHFAMAEISELLLALETIERARQQLLSLESNFLGSPLLNDQHRNMRMDIDNMTYEELLALEEKMGTVSTALSEEMLSQCLKKRIYNHIPLEIQGCSSDDMKCSICQEEYCTGDEVATLACEHLYHAGCIQQWLRMKNWCPVCKVNVASS